MNNGKSKRFELGLDGDESADDNSVDTVEPNSNELDVTGVKSHSTDHPVINPKKSSQDGRVDKSAPNNAAATNSTTDLSGTRLAAALEEGGYQPVILFGNAASGKTSLLLSLIAAIKTLPELKTSVSLSPQVIQNDSEYARNSLEFANRFFYLMTQQFINGEAPSATQIDAPFLIPISLEPVGKEAVKFVFIESNGEWYRPDYTKSTVFPKFRKEIEDFIRNCQRGIIFLHLLPQTQMPVRSVNYDQDEDIKRMEEASLAVSGALNNYRQLRVEKEQDSHLMLVTKWDNRSKEMNVYDALDDDFEEVEEFVSLRYRQAYSSYANLAGSVRQKLLNGFCAGLMNEDGILNLRPDNALRPYVLRYQKNLWRWLYRSALTNQGIYPQDPFPLEKTENWFSRMIHKLLG